MAFKQSNTKKIEPIRPPCKKKVYYTKEEAEEMIVYIRENRRVKDISTYNCTVCGFWHLTSK